METQMEGMCAIPKKSFMFYELLFLFNWCYLIFVSCTVLMWIDFKIITYFFKNLFYNSLSIINLDGNKQYIK